MNGIALGEREVAVGVVETVMGFDGIVLGVLEVAVGVVIVLGVKYN